MKYQDTIDIYSDRGKLLGEKLPLEALSPLYNPYINNMLRTIKSTAFIDLTKLQRMLSKGQVGYTTALRQDEVKTMHHLDLDLLGNAHAIVDAMEKHINIQNYNGYEDDTSVRLFNDDQVLMVRVPTLRMSISTGRDVIYTNVGLLMAQILSEMFDITPDSNPDGCGLIKTALFGRYPQMVTFNPGNPLFGFLRPPQTLEGVGRGFQAVMVNNIVALANRRTLDAVALATIFEQGAQFEMGNAAGWYERYNLLGMAYQGFNANNLVLDLIKENREGTVGGVIKSLMEHAINDGVIRAKGEKYPDVLFSGYKLFTTDDPSMWNAYACAGLLAAVIVNIGASRAAQGISAVMATFGDLLVFESGGLPDPDFGRIMGTGLGFAFYTHSIYGGAGPGAFQLDHVLVRHTSGFFTPCIAGGMCLDSGTQIFNPQATSSLFFKIRDALPMFQDPLQKIVEGAEQIKDKFR
ncbi:MAG: methyl-coenzyme M reductase subunit beta [Candidatus Helarchaeota archaeon]|nr:methyl-coenzyme M reductase subunit beta [Candidatus Helarchaeota archaeon]